MRISYLGVESMVLSCTSSTTTPSTQHILGNFTYGPDNNRSATSDGWEGAWNSSLTAIVPETTPGDCPFEFLQGLDGSRELAHPPFLPIQRWRARSLSLLPYEVNAQSPLYLQRAQRLSAHRCHFQYLPSLVYTLNLVLYL